MSGLNALIDRPVSVCRKLKSRSAVGLKSLNHEISVDHDYRGVDRREQVHQIVADQNEIGVAETELIVERGELFVGRLQLFLRRLQFLDCALQFFVRGL